MLYLYQFHCFFKLFSLYSLNSTPGAGSLLGGTPDSKFAGFTYINPQSAPDSMALGSLENPFETVLEGGEHSENELDEKKEVDGDKDYGQEVPVGSVEADLKKLGKFIDPPTLSASSTSTASTSSSSHITAHHSVTTTPPKNTTPTATTTSSTTTSPTTPPKPVSGGSSTGSGIFSGSSSSSSSSSKGLLGALLNGYGRLGGGTKPTPLPVVPTRRDDDGDDDHPVVIAASAPVSQPRKSSHPLAIPSRS